MSNWKFILGSIILVLVIYFAMDFFRPVVVDNSETKRKIDSLNILILKLQENQLKLDSIITIFNNEIDSVDVRVSKIKGQKTIIREIYHEKINNVNSFDNRQIDSFFSDRYSGIR